MLRVCGICEGNFNRVIVGWLLGCLAFKQNLILDNIHMPENVSIK